MESVTVSRESQRNAAVLVEICRAIDGNQRYWRSISAAERLTRFGILSHPRCGGRSNSTADTNPGDIMSMARSRLGIAA